MCAHVSFPCVALMVWSQSISASCGKSNWHFVWNSKGPCLCLAAAAAADNSNNNGHDDDSNGDGCIYLCVAYDCTLRDIHQQCSEAHCRDFTQFNVVRLDRVLLKQVQSHTP